MQWYTNKKCKFIMRQFRDVETWMRDEEGLVPYEIARNGDCAFLSVECGFALTPRDARYPSPSVTQHIANLRVQVRVLLVVCRAFLFCRHIYFANHDWLFQTQVFQLLSQPVIAGVERHVFLAHQAGVFDVDAFWQEAENQRTIEASLKQLMTPRTFMFKAPWLFQCALFALSIILDRPILILDKSCQNEIGPRAT